MKWVIVKFFRTSSPHLGRSDSVKSWKDRINPQPMFDILDMASKREAQGHYVARMEIGDTPGFRNELLHELVGKYSLSPYRYSPSRGESSLISKVIETQWPKNHESEVVIGPANFLITAALASKTTSGDLILLPDPGFPTYKLSANFLGLKVVYYEVGADGFPDLNALVKSMKVKPKVVIINNPSNPMGVAFKNFEILKSIDNLPELNVEIIFDETYVNLVYDQTETIVEDLPATRLRSLSKEHCAPGLRVGYAVSDTDSANSMANLLSLSVSCVPRFIQLAIAEYLGSYESRRFTDFVKIEMSDRFKKLKAHIPIEHLAVSPNSTFYSLISTANLDGGIAFKLLLEQNVATCPGSKFGESTRNSVRVSLAGEGERFDEDLSLLASGLSSLPKN